MDKISYILGLWCLGILFACKKSESPEPDLTGKWSDKTVIYHFNADNSYATKHLFKQDSTSIDSTYGIIMVDKKRKLISFVQKGYYDGRKVHHTKEVNGSTWKYELKGNVLKYTSNTSIGELTKLY